MGKREGEQGVEAIVGYIEAQLQVLPLSIAAILHPAQVSDQGCDAAVNQVTLGRKPRQGKTASVGNIITAETRSDMSLDLQAAYHPLKEDGSQKEKYLGVVIGNALLAVGSYMKEYGMTEMRTPEMQFLNHVNQALLNGNRFSIAPGHHPIATFDGLAIDSSLEGSPVFGEGGSPGFMEFGDAVALLQWLARYLRGGEHFVTAGDAG